MCSASVRTAIIALMMDAVRTSETSVYFNGATRRYIPQGYHIHTRRPENLKSLIILFHFIFWEGYFNAGPVYVNIIRNLTFSHSRHVCNYWSTKKCYVYNFNVGLCL
jgi:hypothetical protein